jgi:mannose-6-phosphate isomerase-like protein (cupin superfamily)
MARIGLVLDEVDEQIEFLATSADTNGDVVRCRIRVAPGRAAPPEHSHPRQQETFSVEQGTLGYILGSQTLEAEAGNVVVVPSGTNHTFWNAGKSPLVVVADITPALRAEDFIETIHVLIRDGKLAAGGRRANPLRLATVTWKYRNEWRLTKLSQAARALIPVLAFIGRRVGFQGQYWANGKTGSRAVPTAL